MEGSGKLGTNMNYRNALLKGAASSAMLLAVCGGANAATVKHHHAKKAAYGAAPAATYGTGSELSELRAEVQALKAQNDALAQNQAALQAQVAQTQAQTAQIAADAESVQDRLDAVPQTVLTTIGELPKPKPSWADKTQVGSVVFLDASGISQKSNGKSVTPSGTALDIKRAYINIDHQFNDVYSASLTTDFQYIRALNGVGSVAGAAPAVTTTSSATATNELFLKKAYLQAKYFPWFTVRLGGADNAWIPFAEGVEGNRYVENVLIDRTKFGNSTDWGLHILGTFDPIGDPKTGPVVSYQISAVDGAGFRTPPGTNSAPRTDDLDVEGRVSVKWYDLTAAVGGLKGRLGQQAGFQFNAGSNAPTIHRDASRFDALVAYNNGTVKVGAEYFHATNYGAAALTNPTVGDKADGYEVFGGYTFSPEWSVFGRYDYVKPNKTTASTRKDNYFNLGVQYEPTKIVDLSLVYKRDKVDNGTFSTSNGTIGGSTDGTYDEFGLFGQFRF